uniref:Uncharacterized protein n=1 Tax=Anguilla anguilla TaxID=7936 RepID=A0A0E9WPH8_ANGAN
MAPPCLTTKPRKAACKTAGATKGLLLNSLLGHTPVSTAKSSMARQRIMEEERQRVVQAYRLLKKGKAGKEGVPEGGARQAAEPTVNLWVVLSILRKWPGFTGI